MHKIEMRMPLIVDRQINGSARTRNPHELGEGRFRLRRMVDHTIANRDIGAVILKLQGHRITLPCVEPPFA